MGSPTQPWCITRRFNWHYNTRTIGTFTWQSRRLLSTGGRRQTIYKQSICGLHVRAQPAHRFTTCPGRFGKEGLPRSGHNMEGGNEVARPPDSHMPRESIATRCVTPLSLAFSPSSVSRDVADSASGLKACSRAPVSPFPHSTRRRGRDERRTVTSRVRGESAAVQ